MFLLNNIYSVFFLLVISVTGHETKTFECINNECQRTNRPVSNIDPTQLRLNGHHSTLTACRLVCGPNGSLWPIPTGPFILGKNYILTHINNIIFDFEYVASSTKYFLSEIKEIFMNNLMLICDRSCENSIYFVRIDIRVNSSNLNLNWNTNESYKLEVSNGEIKVTAFTVYGVRHALETLSQLFAIVLKPNNVKSLVIIDHAVIEDRPIFTHRGLLIDTARHYLPVSAILRTIDGLAATKMNALHWHATDSQSFPLYIIRRPLMSQYGSYSSQMIYTLEDINYIVTYAKFRGVRIVLELDSPSHAGAGWDWGESFGLGKLAVCVNKEPWRDFCIQPPCGQLNPVNPNTFLVLKDIYADLLTVLDHHSLIHFGGDELFIKCWNSSTEITSSMKNHGMGNSIEDFQRLWGAFHNRQTEILDQLQVTQQEGLLVWSSALTEPASIEKYFDKSRFVIQTWVESYSTIPNELLNRGYRLIMSTKDAWYLDHGFWGRTKYHSWRDVYNNRIPRHEGVIGGEVCMWSEYVDEVDMDARIWPRAAAFGERLWSDCNINSSTINVESRILEHTARLRNRGIKTDVISPTWCAQRVRKCA